MAIIDRPLRITRITCSEIRTVMAGPSPRCLAKMLYVDEGGITCGQVLLQAWSARSLQLLKALGESLEYDMMEVLGLDIVPEEGEEPGERDEGEEG